MDATARCFIPPHCPRTDCCYHASAVGWTWVRFGRYRRHCEPRVIQRFRCGHCRRTFSSQSFDPTYWLKRPELQLEIFGRLLGCSGYRQIARLLRCDPTTVMSQAARLGRHCLLLLHERRPRGPVLEPLVVDGFESFAHSQYHPLYLNLAVGADSHIVYAFTHSELRRKGTMTARQKLRRSELEQRLGRPDPKAIELGTAAVVKLAAPVPQPLTIRSDEHQAYPRAFRRLQGYRVEHQMTPSVEARTPGNPLFPVNLMDLLLRHNSANHKRETIAFSRRHQAVIERAAVLIAWANYAKPFSERLKSSTRAMRLGIEQHRLSLKRLLDRRWFYSRVGLPEEWQRYYRREVEEREIARPRRHALKLAF